MMTSELLFVSAKADPMISFQEGLDEGHEGLNDALKRIIGHMPPPLLRIVVEDIARFERDEPISSLTEEVFHKAICLYQKSQLTEMNPSDVMMAS